jgi:broad specificity phosphatase PhoE
MYTTTFASVGNDLFFKSQSVKSTSVETHFSLAKTAAAVDTLIAVKSGYVTKKIPITSYTQNDITISLDSNLTDPHDQIKKGLTIYFIRHAETVANASGETGGGGPVEDHDTLTALGEKQIEELKNFLVKEKIVPDLVVVSPTWRTQKTIEPFLIAAKQKGEIWVELNECCGQEQSGAPIPTVRPDPRWKMKIAVISDNFTFRTADDIYFWWPSTYEEGLFMVMTARDRLLEKFSQSGKTIVVVGHAVNGGILLGLLRGYDMLTTKPDRPVYLLNTGIVKLTQDTVSGAFTIKQNMNKPPAQ